jgi:hypothetical protein
MKFWYGSGSADPYLRLMDPDPDSNPDPDPDSNPDPDADANPAIFVSDLKVVKKS